MSLHQLILARFSYLLIEYLSIRITPWATVVDKGHNGYNIRDVITKRRDWTKGSLVFMMAN